MSTRPAAWLLLGLLAGGCGDGGPSSGGGPPPPFPGGETPALGGGNDRLLGNDRGGGVDRDGGSAPAIGTAAPSSPQGGGGLATCTEPSECGTGAYCSRSSSATIGYCITTCTLPGTEVLGTSERCPSGWACVRPSLGSVAICAVPCQVADSCPPLAGMTSVCAFTATTEQRFCAWRAPVSGQ